MRIRAFPVVGVVLLGAALVGCAASTPQPVREASSSPASASGSVWVADETGNSITVIDVATNSVTTTVHGVEGPHNVQASRDGATAYVVSSTNVLVAIDTATYTIEAVAPTGPEPAHVIEAPNGKVYVTNAGDGSVSVYQTPALAPTGRIELGGMPHGLRPASGGSVIVVANTMKEAVDLIDPGTDRFLGEVPVGPGPAQVAVSADGRYAYTGIADPPAVVKVDIPSRTVVGSTPVPASPVQVYLTPDEATVLSADQGTRETPGRTVSVIDTGAMSARGTVNTGSGPHGVVIDTSGTTAWVTNSFDNTVSIIDLASLSAVATVPVGAGPNGISYSPRPPAVTSPATTTVTIPVPSSQPQTQQPADHHGH